MAIGDTDIVICNKALTFLAADPITSFSDGIPLMLVIEFIRLLKNRPLVCTRGLLLWGSKH